MEKSDSNTKSGVVVYLDALGTSNRTIEASGEFIKKRNTFLKCAEESWKIREGQFNKDLEYHLPKPEIATVQDSIIICWSNEEQKQDSLPIYLSAGQWLIDAIPWAIGYELFFRGSISVGDYIFNTSPNNVTVIGPAVYKATHCEPFADWIGVIQTTDCQKEFLSFCNYEAKKENLRIRSKSNAKIKIRSRIYHKLRY